MTYVRSAVAYGLALMTLVGCENLKPNEERSLFDPSPSMKLQSGPALPDSPRAREVKITNGAGEVLYDGPVSAKDELVQTDARQSQMDGTLKIETKWTDGETTTQTLTHEPNKPIKLDYSAVTRMYSAEVVPPPEPKAPTLELGVSGGPAAGSVGETGFGTQVAGPDDEVSIDTSDGWLTGYSLKAEFGYQLQPSEPAAPVNGEATTPGRAPRVYGWYGMTVLDGSSSESVPVGTDPIGATYINLMSPANATGVIFGASGADIEIDTELRHHDLQVGMGWPIRTMPNCNLDLTTGLFWNRRTLEQEARFTTPTFPDVFVDWDEEVEEDRFGVALGLSGRHTWDDGFFMMGGVGAELGWRDAELDADQHVVVPVNPNPADQNFRIGVNDSDDGFAYGAWGEAGIGWRFNHWGIDLTGRIDYLGDVGVARNPANPNERATHLDDEDEWLYTIRAGFNANW